MRSSFILALFAFTLASAHAADGYRAWKIGLSYEGDSVGIDLTPKSAENEKLTFRPSSSNYAGVILGYRWLAGTIAFAVPAKRQIRQEEGQSDYSDSKISYYVRRWGIEAGYNRYKGYLIDNSDKLSAATLNGQTYYRLPEMRSQGYGLNFFYVGNPKAYSMPAAFDQSEPQRGSAGSLIGIFSFRHQYFRNDSGIIPTANVASFGTDGTLAGVATTNSAIGGGYGFLWDGPAALFASLFGGFTLGWNHLQYDLQNAQHSMNTSQFNAHIRLSLGLNGQRGFLKITALNDYYNYSTESIKVGNSIFSTLVAGGLRF